MEAIMALVKGAVALVLAVCLLALPLSVVAAELTHGAECRVRGYEEAAARWTFLMDGELVKVEFVCKSDNEVWSPVR